jgi:quercetin dioxygenase-like cupin family protein
MVYVISGEIVEYRNDKVRTLKSGDSIIEDFNTVHAYENKSNQDCILIAFDIPKSETNKHLEKFIGK